MDKKILEEIINQSVNGIYIVDRETLDILYVNRAAENLLKKDQDQIINRKCYSVIRGMEVACEHCDIWNCECGLESILDKEFESRDGRYFRARKKETRWEGRKAFICYISEVTEYHASQKKLQDLANGLPGGMGIYYLYPNGQVLLEYLNDGFYELLGETREERRKYTGFDTFNSVQPEDKSALISAMQNAVHHGGKLNAEIRIKHKKGHYHWYRVQGTVASVTQERSEFYLLFTDIHEMKQLQHSIEKAYKESKEATRAKEDFLDRMSHDLRTPLNGILGMVEVSKDEEDIGIIRDNLKQIERAGNYLLKTTGDALDLHQLEQEKLQLHPVRIKCGDYIENLVQMVIPSAKEKEIDFEFINLNIDMTRFMKADVTRMSQIFIAVLSNAIKFTPRGGNVKLTVERLKHENGYDYDKFQVIDNGIGISQKFIEQSLFQPYAQEYNTESGEYGGTGLGLAIAKNLIELMDGRIEVESKVGEGTMFTVYLRFEIMDDTEHDEHLNLQKLYQHLAEKKILVCEDHLLNAQILQRLLERAGCIVNHATDGLEGVQAFSKEKTDYYDAILMDIRMPQLSGIDATKIIRGLDRMDAKTIPIIAVSANAYPRDVHRCLAAGMNAHIAKPIDPTKLYQVLCQMINKKGKR